VRAAVTTEDHGFEIVEVPDPTPGPGELAIRVAACGVCGSDIKAQPYMPAGMVMGHEFGGEIVAAGPGVGDWREGTNVAVLPVVSCGSCRYCADGAAVRPRGRIVISGACAEPTPIEPITALLKELTIHYSVCYTPNEFREVITAFSTGAIDPTAMMGVALGLDRIADAFDLVRDSAVHGRTEPSSGSRAATISSSNRARARDLSGSIAVRMACSARRESSESAPPFSAGSLIAAVKSVTSS